MYNNWYQNSLAWNVCVCLCDLIDSNDNVFMCVCVVVKDVSILIFFFFSPFFHILSVFLYIFHNFVSWNHFLTFFFVLFYEIGIIVTPFFFHFFYTNNQPLNHLMHYLSHLSAYTHTHTHLFANHNKIHSIQTKMDE